MSANLYEQDFYAWANQQAGLLRAGKLSQADIEHIAEEIESMGKTEKRELISRLAVLLAHMLKWRFQPERRTKSWRLTIEEQRRQVIRHMRDNPSLKSRLFEAIEEAYGDYVKIFDHIIPMSVRAAEMSAEGISIFRHDPKGKVALAYAGLTEEVLTK